MTLKDVLDAGTTGVMAVAVVALWTRLNIVTDRFFARLDQGDAERKVIANEVGINAQDMAHRVANVRKEKRNTKN